MLGLNGPAAVRVGSVVAQGQSVPKSHQLCAYLTYAWLLSHRPNSVAVLMEQLPLVMLTVAIAKT